MRRLRLDDASVATILEWVRLAAAFPIPRLIWSLFMTSVVLQIIGARQPESAWEAIVTIGSPAFLFFAVLRLLAKRVGVLGMRDPIPGAQ